jgi:hypothetical protein
MSATAAAIIDQQDRNRKHHYEKDDVGNVELHA